MRKSRQQAFASHLTTYLDLYLIVIVGLVFTALGATGIATVQTLASLVLGTLVIFAVSIARVRHDIRIVKDADKRPDIEFLTEKPPELAVEREQSTDFLFIGISGSRTIQSYGRQIARMLEKGSTVRMLVMEPNDKLCATVAQLNPRTPSDTGADLKERSEVALAELDRLAVQAKNLYVRTLPFVPRFGAHGFDLNKRTGILYVQHYEYRPNQESGPTMKMRSGRTRWYEHFADEMERLWEAGTPRNLVGSAPAPRT